jgi:outer membrane protein assembly factor BamD (BamD/ComL family)
MKKVVHPILVAFIVSFVAAPAVWAGGAADMSKQCQEALKKTPNVEAAQLCTEGDQLLKAGKTADAEAKFAAGLEKLGIKVESGKKY